MGMTRESAIRRICLSVESSDLEAGALAYCEALLPGIEVNLCSPEEFEQAFDQDYDPGELRVLMLHADEHGHLDGGMPVIQSLMRSNIPVLVIRHSQGGTVPDATIRRIVVPLDGSTTAGQAIPIASQVAKVLDVPVRFLMVIDPARVIPPAYAYDPDAWSMIEALRHTSHWALSQAEAAMKQDGIAVGSDLMFGPINASLSATIGEGDLVVMTTHGTDRHRLRYPDSVALRTLVAIPQPILLMRAQSEAPVVVDAYQACSWAEPLQRDSIRTA